MNFKILFIPMFVSLTCCIEPYEFVIQNNSPTLVVEGFISNVSYCEAKTYPSAGRYFYVKLSYTNDVTNTRGKVVRGALIKLISDIGENWEYQEDMLGTYFLMNEDFKATQGTKYKLQIQISEKDIYESDWVELPIKPVVSKMGNISFREVEHEQYAIIANKEEVVTIRGIDALINLPEHDSMKPIYYKWKYEPTWIYIAPLARASQPDKKCWATNENYLTDYNLQADITGGYYKDLFFIETDGNERIYEELSVLIVQQILSEDFYFFYKELMESTQEDVLLDKPPYNLPTNISSLGGDKRVSGYFGAVLEQAKRWYFNKRELSYFILDDLRENCIEYADIDGPAPECLSCLEYSNGNAFLERPAWWKL